MRNLAFLEPRVVTRHRRTFPSPDPRDPEVRLTLRTELFLIAHDHQTGRAHIDRRSLCLGLALAILLELWLDGRIMIGKSYDVREAVYHPDPGRITVTDPTSYGDPLTDAAITLLNRTGGRIYVTDFIRRFASLDLYDRVRGDMLAIGVLHCTSHRRFGLFRKDRYLAIKEAWAVQARSRLRDLPKPRNRHDHIPDFPDMQTVALAGLVTALGLTRNLHHPEPAELHGQLMNITTRTYDSSIRDTAAAITPGNRRYVR
jgi:hypothetical protein